MKKYLWGIFYGVLLTAFTAYVLMDTFVITRIYQTAPSSEEAQAPESGEENPDGSEVSRPGGTTGIAVNSYQDGNLSITITEYREYDTSIYVADVQLSSAESFKTALANNAYGKNVTAKTSEIAAENNAILAINGDFYGSRENGYVLRNGVLYRSTASTGQEDLVVYADGSFQVISETAVTAEQLLADGAQQIFSFGPALVVGGQIAVTADEEVGKAKTSNPRTAVGIVDGLHYLFVVSDGRTEESEGLSLYELAAFLQALDVKTAYNLDGGGSSTLYFNGEIVNNPTTNGRSIQERGVSDIVYIGY